MVQTPSPQKVFFGGIFRLKLERFVVCLKLRTISQNFDHEYHTRAFYNETLLICCITKIRFFFERDQILSASFHTGVFGTVPSSIFKAADKYMLTPPRIGNIRIPIWETSFTEKEEIDLVTN